jgi:DNA polymerase I
MRYGRKYFRRSAVLDFEYEIEYGGLPNVLCLVAYILDSNLQLIEIVRRWRGEFGTSPPFPIDDDTLIVGYSLWAEMTCFMQLGWRFPKTRLRPAYRLFLDQQHFIAVQSR